MTHKFLEDLTSDVMFEASGKTLAGAFEAAAEAVFEVVCGKSIKAVKKITVQAEAKDEKALLHRWLSKLLTAGEIENLFFGKFKVEIRKTKAGLTLAGTAWGEEATPEKGGTVVKAVTYYGLAVEKGPKGYIVRASLDI